jgi:hypothetical protein
MTTARADPRGSAGDSANLLPLHWLLSGPWFILRLHGGGEGVAEPWTGAVVDEPKTYRAIMVSSTFTDLREHRQQVIRAIETHGFRANVMENDGARADADVIGSSLNFVRDSAAYVGVISRKYGQTPHDPKRNPDRLSITELEFEEAIRLERPILLFIMGEKHPVTEADIELDPDKRKKLEAFRERAKRKDPESEVERVYQVFESLQEFSAGAAIAIGRLAKFLEPEPAEGTEAEPEAKGALPRPPEPRGSTALSRLA